MVCLLTNLPEVQAQLDKYTNILGSEDAAYYVLSENNGYELDKAPNGLPSKLFSDLLSHYNGDRNAAIQAKAKVYSEAFKNWFGDWLSDDKTNVSKVVDENGEPLIVYHGTRTSHDIKTSGFSKNMSGKGNRGADNLQFYFTNSYENAEYTGVKAKELNPLIDIITSVYDLFDSTELPAYDQLYLLIDNNRNKIRELRDKLRSVKDDSFIKRIFNSLLSIFNVNVSTADDLRERYNDAINDLDSLIKDLLHKIEVLYNFNAGMKFMSGDRTQTSVNTLNFIKESINDNSPYRQFAANLLINLLYGTHDLLYSPEVLPVFLNIKAPLITDFKFKSTDENPLFMDRFSDEFEKYNNREQDLLRQLSSDKFDGSISKNKFDILFGDIYIAKEPNQIKSIDNQGNFSTLNNNIYQNQAQRTSESKKVINFYNIFDPEQSTRMTSREFIANVRSYFPSEDTTINRLLDLFSNVDVPIRIVETESLPQGKAYMYYNTTTGEITVAIDEFNNCSIGYNAVSMLHEMVHAFTANSINAAKKGVGITLENQVYEKLNKLYKVYKEVFSNESNENGDFSGDFYGLNNELEFAAELLTNSSFYGILLDHANQRSTGLFNKVYNAIREFFNSVVDLITGRERTENDDNEVISTRNLLMELLEYNVLNNNTTQEDFFLQNTRLNAQLLFNQSQTALRYHFDTVDELNKRLRDIRNKLAKGLASRLKAVELDESTSYEQKEQIKYQLRNLNDATIDDISVIMSFTKELALDVPVIAKKVLNAYKGNSPALSDDTLVSLSKNYFGFYCDYANTLYNNLSNMDTYRDTIGEDNYNTLMRLLALCKNILDTCYDHVKRMQAENAKRLLTNIGLSANSSTILKYMEENFAQTNSDISVLSRMFLSLDKMNDEALRGLFKLVQDTENIIDNNTSVVARKLLSLAKKAGNRQKALYELDDNGKPTGFIIRDRKYGKMRKDYREALKKIRKDLGINENDLGLPENREIRIEYNRRKNEWLNKHVERKYTSEYYTYFLELSLEATTAREIIQDKIRSLKDKYRSEDGIVRYEKFSDEDYRKLQSYYFEKKSLASIYNVDGSIKEEGTVERRIADELTALNEKLSKGLKMKTNREKFEQVRKQKEKEYGADSIEYKKWFLRNTRTVLSEEFYKLLDSINRETYPDTDYEALNKEKRALLNMFRDSFTGEVNVKLMPAVTKNRINRIDQQLANIRRSKKAKVSKTGLKFKDIAKIVATDNYNRDRGEAMAADATQPGELEAFDAMHSIFDLHGMNHPRSYYSKVMPIDSKYISIEPSLEFAEMSEESPFLNKNYDLSNPEYYQPKKSLYDNTKEYNKVMQDKELRELRELIINIIKQSNRKLNNLQGLNEYKLPLISGSMYRFLKARGFTGIGYKLADIMNVRNDDTGIRDKVITAPDGSSLAMVPLYFIKDLDDPATITADLIGSVIQYYRMAENFKLKSAIKGKVENIKAFLRLREFTGTRGKLDSILRHVLNPQEGSSTNTYKMAEKFINMNVYDVRTDNFSISIGNKQINFTKLLLNLKNYGTLVNLGLNFSCAFTGFFTALHAHLCNVIMGRYYTFEDSLSAFKDLIWDILRHGITAGNRNYKSELMAQMDYFQVGSTMDSLWEHSNRPRWVNVITKHWAFGTYALTDYLIKGQILRSVMYNYRNVEGTFMYREQFLLKYGNTELNRKKWKEYRSFAGSIKMIGGKPVAIDPKDLQAIDKIKYTIGNTAKNVAQSADGLLTLLQKSLFTTNVFGAMCMMHRLYIPLLILENFTMKRHWDYTSLREIEALFLTPLRLFSMLYKDKLTLKGLYNYILNDSVTKGNLRKLAFELSMILVIYPLIVKAVTSEADDDKKDIIKNMFAYVMLRTAFESRSKYTINDIYGTIKSPTPLSTLLDNFGNIVNETISPITNLFSLTESRERDKRITRGAYKNMTPLERSIIKSTPFKNIIELNDLPTKRNYYETQIVK